MNPGKKSMIKMTWLKWTRLRMVILSMRHMNNWKYALMRLGSKSKVLKRTEILKTKDEEMFPFSLA